MNEIIVADLSSAAALARDVPYAMITFVSSLHHRTPPRIVRPPTFKGRIIIRADDTVPAAEPGSRLKLFSDRDAERIARFAVIMAPHIDVLCVTCVHGEGRSPAVAAALSRHFGLPWERFMHAPYSPNPWIKELTDAALDRLS